MKFTVRVCCLSAFALAALTIGISQLAGACLGGHVQTAFYSGALAGVALAASGMPFVMKLARIGACTTDDAKFWRLWGAGLLLRSGLLLALGIPLALLFRDHPAVVLLPMVGLYLAGLFAETAWLARILFSSAAK